MKGHIKAIFQSLTLKSVPIDHIHWRAKDGHIRSTKDAGEILKNKILIQLQTKLFIDFSVGHAFGFYTIWHITNFIIIASQVYILSV